MPSTIDADLFVQTVKQLLKDKAWSQAELAQRSGISKAQLSRLLAGKNRRVQQATVDKVRTAFAIDSDEFALLLQKPLADHQALVSSDNLDPATSVPARIRIDRLPTVSGELFGREAELQLLDDALHNDAVRIVQFIASGGTGKTKLLRHWLDAQADSSTNYIAWSFYSQGTDDSKQASSHPFFNDIFKAFGRDIHEFQTDEDRADALIDLLTEHHCVLVLDGLEPLQQGGRGFAGQLKDRAIRHLLRRLSQRQQGLCIITTRIGVYEIQDRPRVISHSLDNLNLGDGVCLLRALGVQGRDADVEQAVAEVEGHALTLHLLGNALTTYLDGDIRKRDTLGELIDDFDAQGRHAYKVMQAYQTWFRDEDGKPTAELQLLYLLGLFAHPIEAGVLQVLWDEQIPHLTQGVPAKAWKIAIRDLREKHRLLSAYGERPDLLDCHPLIREYFGSALQQQYPDAWQQAHECLYEYYKALPDKEFPDTLEEMQPLFAAVEHGCKAGLYNEALTDVVRPRIRRDAEFYLGKKLGAFNQDLSVLSNFFETPWSSPVDSLDIKERTVILNWAGIALQATGRLRESLTPIQNILEALANMRDMSGFAITSLDRIKLQLMLGDISDAIDSCRFYIESSQNITIRGTGFDVYAVSTCAHVFSQAGKTKLAYEYFIKALKVQRRLQPKTPCLDGIDEFYYCEFLLDQEETAKAYEVAEVLLKRNLEFAFILDVSLAQLLLGKIDLRQDSLIHSRRYFEFAIAGLRKAGQQYYLGLGLLAQAAYYREIHDFEAANQNLQEVYDIAEPAGMRLILTDYHLEMARLLIAQWQANPETHDAQEIIDTHIQTAITLINETGYHRRDAEVAALVGSINSKATAETWSEEW